MPSNRTVFSTIPVIRVALQYVPWIIIMVGGTVAFMYAAQGQDELRAHQGMLSRQASVVESIRHEFDIAQEKERLARAAIIQEATFKQCIAYYKTDENLIELVDDIMMDSAHVGSGSLNSTSRGSLVAFSARLFKEKSQMDCTPITPPKGVPIPK